MPSAQQQEQEKKRAPGDSAPNPFGALYALLSDTRFAIIVIIALAVASILGIAIIDQVPFRGEMARMRFADRLDDPQIWLLIHVVPEHPFRCLVFRTLLALLSLSLLACVIRRWRRRWRQAFTIPWLSGGILSTPGAVVWTVAEQPEAESVIRFFRKRFFNARWKQTGATLTVTASRFGVARLGAVMTHLGFLLLVVGGLWMASAGFSHMVWMRPGEAVEIPGTDARLELRDFRIEMTPRGAVSDYISSVRLMRDTTVIRETEIEVNKPLRYRGRSFYQSSYRRDPLKVRSLNLVYDAPLGPIPVRPVAPGNRGVTRRDGSSPGTHTPRPDGSPMHGMTQSLDPKAFANPTTLVLPAGDRTPLPGTPYAAEIDTFFADFLMSAEGPRLGSAEPSNPAVRLRFFEADSLIGRTWYFLFHPDMPVGTGPELPLRFASYDPLMQTGLELATHPGSQWVWAGIVVMSLGTVLAFLLRHEQVWLRIRKREDVETGGWELAMIHRGASPQDPALAQESWGAAITPLTGRLLEKWAPTDGAPERWPGSAQIMESTAAAGSTPITDSPRAADPAERTKPTTTSRGKP